MAKILLTSSQASVVVTAFIVFLCTLALFLSGYVIQQRTLRDLRAAIRPREAPKIRLPDQFKLAEAKLEDGSIMFVESEADREARMLKESVVVEIKPSMPAVEVQPQRSDDSDIKADKSGATQGQLAMVEALKAQAAQKSWAVENPDPLSKSRIPISRAERRRLIKTEIQRLAQSEKPVYYQRRLW